jgi:hypothetical protein
MEYGWKVAIAVFFPSNSMSEQYNFYAKTIIIGKSI